jgi:hypothetical protein
MTPSEEIEFDKAVEALRGKVPPKQKRSGLRKGGATPEEWAANLDYFSAVRSQPERRAKQADYNKRYAEENAESLLEYRRANKSRRNESSRQWARNNPDRVRQNAARRSGDIQHRLRQTLRERVRAAISRGQKVGSAISDLGCSVEFLIQHIESQFVEGMTWANWGKGDDEWSLDHIYPLAKADLTNRVEFLAVCNWRNLRPTWHRDNREKRCRVTGEAKALFASLCQERASAS